MGLMGTTDNSLNRVMCIMRMGCIYFGHCLGLL